MLLLGTFVAIGGTTPIVGDNNYSSSSTIVISSNTNGITDTTIIKKSSPTSSDGNVTISDYYNYRYYGTTVEIGKDENKKGVLIVEGDLTINGKSILTIKKNSTVIVKGNLTIATDATLNINEGANLFVYGNLKQQGKTVWAFWLFDYVDTGDINANNAGMIAIGGNYEIYTADDPNSGNSYINPANNPNFYVFGENNLSDVGIKTNPKNPSQFETATGFSSISALLPIELTSFTATATEYGFTFNWVTASEKNNDYFTLEFSENGEEFIAIDYIHGAGTTSETSEYEYVWDAKPTADILYFRLKQTDYNGEFTYSDILVYAPKKSHGANRILYYGPLKLNVVDGQLQYIVE